VPTQSISETFSWTFLMVGLVGVISTIVFVATFKIQQKSMRIHEQLMIEATAVIEILEELRMEIINDSIIHEVSDNVLKRINDIILKKETSAAVIARRSYRRRT